MAVANRSSYQLCRGKAPFLSLLLLCRLLISVQIVASKSICPHLQPIKCHPSSALTATIGTAATKAALLPRGGGASKISSATSATPAASNPLAEILSSFVRTVLDARSQLAAAAAARCVSIFGMYPVDTIKTRMQMKQADAFRASGLFNGVAGSLVGQVPYGVLTFGSYEIYKQSLLNRFTNIKPAFIYALAAIMGDVTGSGWLCPSEVMKQQIQAGIYPSMGEAIKGIWRKSGVAGFYQGFTGGLARDVPFRVAQLTTFEVTKNIYLRAKQSKDDSALSLSSLEAAICGAAAGSFSAAITNPLDRIKTLMMTDTTNAYGGSVVTCAAKILRDDGLTGLFAGVVPRVAYIAPSVCIFFVTYEFVQQKMKETN
eukprot:CAMPEP_0172553140 /NCGR_PEP_ID=MMETSP1067-20121228/48751_1 /TAXON_ID=265564 ORGANISM="Thalassiosira punctigera, Strain Tpunct2005C2" /NCGR_SAMPLE_ID=MMETSP1067 /ASSEMBLY_ACC=CAM_ASM_000444 /LENGTH=371 /DNA_ID=CAMNT_0013341257 /DNA_START=87 /DNA_END=1202 /DNA_ORIENTATION=+